jgi:hypothetical protein
MNRGKLVIVIILGVALFAAGFSTWYHYRGQHRAISFWAANTAVLIAEAPQVRVFQLGESSAVSEESGAADEPGTPPDGADAESQPPAVVEFGGLDWKVVSSKDARSARGGNNVRRALVIDTTFDWKGPPSEEAPHWQYALAVNDGRYWATILFDFESRRVALAGGKKTALLDPAANADFQQFFAEQFPDEPGEQPDENASEKPAEDAAAEPADKK